MTMKQKSMITASSILVGILIMITNANLLMCNGFLYYYYEYYRGRGMKEVPRRLSLHTRQEQQQKHLKSYLHDCNNGLETYSSKKWSNQHHNDNRRNFIQSCYFSTVSSLLLFITPKQVNAKENVNDIIVNPSFQPSIIDNNIQPKTLKPKKPFAPLSALLPATRVKMTIDDALIIADEIIALDDQLSSSSSSSSSKNNIPQEKIQKISQLQELIIQREKKGFMNPFNDTTKNNNSNNNIIFTKSQMPISNSKLYDETYKDKLKNLPITDIPLTLLTQAGDKRQFSILQRRQRVLEKNNPIREALNFYTRQLKFDTEFYILNANAEEKKRMIRNDALPDIQSVIVSDLDLRDLVRNQILDAFDDVKAEFEYQLQNSMSKKDNTKNNLNGINNEFDAKELNVLLLRAQKECNQWFSFIDEKDIIQALDAVALEKDNLLTPSV